MYLSRCVKMTETFVYLFDTHVRPDVDLLWEINVPSYFAKHAMHVKPARVDKPLITATRSQNTGSKNWCVVFHKLCHTEKAVVLIKVTNKYKMYGKLWAVM